ncbi:Uncharacterized membrane protein [Paraoerskovia marina]|uniref:Uncharacterized membrane protein n=1 Tax=Paraoerskovia marina TaxID=545619 RepID=A0A1H1N087_9CELL|nr:Uncharacterized membrane protein [Paraoerskovia marina]
MHPVARWFTAYLIAAVVFGVLDALWITLVALPTYEAEIPTLLGETINAPAGAAFYLLFLVGLVHFGVRPQDRTAGLGSRVRDGALLGAVAYGTWGLTALAVIGGFSTLVAVTDLLWGAAASAVVTLVTALVLRPR